MMNLANYDPYFTMPARVYQYDLNQVDYSDFYEIAWDGPNNNFGSFRVDRLKRNVAQGKRQVLNVLKAAYRGLTLKSFDEALTFSKHMGIQIYRVRKGEYTYCER